MRQRVARSLTLLLAGATLVAVPTSAPAPSEAAWVYLCKGYAGCTKAGYSDAGYGARNRTMYWRMYSGHNCTNYVAYRMIKNGMSTNRPWSGSGMAYNWGRAMSRVTNQTPKVGAVAWFDRGQGGVGSSGHVAYVERVVSASEIVISEDSWGGDFSWRTLRKGTNTWPSGFIHFTTSSAPTPPPPPTLPAIAATAPPTVVGTPQVGVPLQGTAATFRQAGVTHRLQWRVNGVDVPGATGLTYTPTAKDVGKTVVLRDIGTRAGFTDGAAYSAPTAAVVPAAFARVAKPAVSGSPELGQVLTAVAGSWRPAPASVVYRWRADGVWLEGRNGPTLTVTADLRGKRISVVEVARRPGYPSIGNASADTEPVVDGAVELATPFQPGGTARVGSTLAFTPGTWAPSDATASTQWYRDDVAVPGATGSTYAVTPADAGRRITVGAVVRRPRFRDAATSADFGVVTTPSRMAARPGGRKGYAVVDVRIAAPGVAAPSGTIWARVNGKVARGTVTNGVAKLKIANLRAGTKSMFVLYAGNGVVEEARQTVKVIVKPKPRKKR
ncbi:CHAP domain-containing protein [Nocardioides sp. C4-1]|uniref:CHAP domain-containing protein n=1 Tax=Nocardioides sp. C4-1 TaxID=3151851 RepID=UPI003266A324